MSTQSKKFKDKINKKSVIAILSVLLLVVAGIICFPWIISATDLLQDSGESSFTATEKLINNIFGKAEIEHVATETDIETKETVMFAGNKYWVVHPDNDDNSVVLYAKNPYLWSTVNETNTSEYSGGNVDKFFNSATYNYFPALYPANTTGNNTTGFTSAEGRLHKFDGTVITENNFIKEAFLDGKISDWNAIKIQNSVSHTYWIKDESGTIKKSSLGNGTSSSQKLYLPDAYADSGSSYVYAGTGSAKDDTSTDYNILPKYFANTGNIDSNIVATRAREGTENGEWKTVTIKKSGDTTSYSSTSDAVPITPVCTLDLNKVLFASYLKESDNSTEIKCYKDTENPKSGLDNYNAVGLTILDDTKETEQADVKSTMTLNSDVDIINGQISFKLTGELKDDEYLAVIVDDNNKHSAIITANKDTSAEDNNTYKVSYDTLSGEDFDIETEGNTFSIKVLVCKDDKVGIYSDSTGDMYGNGENVKVDKYFLRHAKQLFSGNITTKEQTVEGDFLASKKNTYKMFKAVKINNDAYTNVIGGVYFGGNEYYVVNQNVIENDAEMTNGSVTLLAKEPYLYLGLGNDDAGYLYNKGFISSYLNGRTWENDIETVPSFIYYGGTYGGETSYTTNPIKPKKCDGTNIYEGNGTEKSQFHSIKDDFFSDKETEWSALRTGNLYSASDKNNMFDGITNNCYFYLPDIRVVDGTNYAYAYAKESSTVRAKYKIPLGYFSTYTYTDSKSASIAVGSWTRYRDTGGDTCAYQIRNNEAVTSYSNIANAVAPVCNIDLDNIIFTSYTDQNNTISYDTSDDTVYKSNKKICLTLEDKKGDNVADNVSLKGETSEKKLSDEIQNADALTWNEDGLTFKVNPYTKKDENESLAVLLDDGKTTALITEGNGLSSTSEGEADGYNKDIDGYIVYRIEEDFLKENTKLELTSAISIKIMSCEFNQNGNYKGKTLYSSNLQCGNYIIRYAKVIYSSTSLDYSQSDNTQLSDLVIDNEEVEIEQFSPNTYVYDVDVNKDIENLDFTAYFDNSKVTVKMYEFTSGTVTEKNPTLDYTDLGSMINKTSTVDTIKTKRINFSTCETDEARYKFVVYGKTNSKSASIYYVVAHIKPKMTLTDLTVKSENKGGTLSLDFSDTTYEYNITLDNELDRNSNVNPLDNITFNLEGENLKAEWKYNDGDYAEVDSNANSFLQQISPGLNIFKIKCSDTKSEKFTKVYTITIEYKMYEIEFSESDSVCYTVRDISINTKQTNNSYHTYGILYTTDGSEPGFKSTGTLKNSTKTLALGQTISITQNTKLNVALCGVIGVYKDLFEDDAKRGEITSDNSYLSEIISKEYILQDLPVITKLSPVTYEQYYESFTLVLEATKKPEYPDVYIKYSVDDGDIVMEKSGKVSINIKKPDSTSENKTVTVKAWSCDPKNTDSLGEEYSEDFKFDDLPAPVSTVKSGKFIVDSIELKISTKSLPKGSSYDIIRYTTEKDAYPTASIGEKYTLESTIKLSKTDAYELPKSIVDEYELSDGSKGIVLNIFAAIGQAVARGQYVYVFTDLNPVTTENNTPTSGIYYKDRSEKLVSKDAEEIRYTLDGSDPIYSSTATTYNGDEIKITKGSTTVLKATAILCGHNSGVQSFVYNFVDELEAPVPTIVPDSSGAVTTDKMYYKDLSIELELADDENAESYYNIDSGKYIKYNSGDSIVLNKTSDEGEVTLVCYSISKLDGTVSKYASYKYHFIDMPEPTITPAVQSDDNRYESFDFVINTDSINSPVVKYKINNGVLTDYTGAVKITSDMADEDTNKVNVFYQVTSEFGQTKQGTNTYKFASLNAPVISPEGGEYYTDVTATATSSSVPDGTTYQYKIYSVKDQAETQIGETQSLEAGESLSISKVYGDTVKLEVVAKYKDIVSEVSTVTYNFLKVPTVEFNVDDQTVDEEVKCYSQKTVKMVCQSPATKVKYLINSSDMSNAITGNEALIKESDFKNSKCELFAVACIEKDGEEVACSDIKKLTLTMVSIEKPIITPEDTQKEYTEAINVQIKSETNVSDADLKIYYTTDGTDPTEESTEYTGSFKLDPIGTCTKTVKAITVVNGKTSEISEKVYNFNMVDIDCDRDSATYYGDIDVTLTSTTAGATIYYTTGGEEPTRDVVSGVSNLYQGKFTVEDKNQVTTIKAIAWKGNYCSRIIERTLKFDDLSSPYSSVTQGTYYKTLENVELLSSNSRAKIYYTTNGDTPRQVDSYLYTDPITIKKDTKNPTKLKIMACADGSTSEIVTYTYSFQNLATPYANETSGTYYDDFLVTLTVDDPDCYILYTLAYDNEEKDPSKQGEEYTEEIKIEKKGHNKATLRALSYKIVGGSKLEGEEMTPIVYTLKEVATPEPSIAEGTYYSSLSITLSCETAGATMYYSINESEAPTQNSTQFNGDKFDLIRDENKDTTIVLQTVAYSGSSAVSSVGKYTYYLKHIDQPTISPDSGKYWKSQIVTMSCENDSATIKYTTDGSDPAIDNGSMMTYKKGEEVTISGERGEIKTIKAVAFIGKNSSKITTVKYEFGKLADPKVNIGNGTYYSNQTLIFTSEANTSVRFTYSEKGDPEDPTIASDEFNKELVIGGREDGETEKVITIKARAYSNNDSSIYSDVAKWTYTFKQIEKPQVNVEAGTYFEPQTIKLSLENMDDENVAIRYTLDNTQATATNGTKYTEPFTISNQTASKVILRAVAYVNNDVSEELICEYNFPDVLAPPASSKESGTYYTNQYIELTAENSEADIRYTLDGSDPTRSSRKYQNKITIPKSNEPIVLKAKAYLKELESEIATYTYTFAEVAVPVVSPKGGKYNQNVVADTYCDTSGAVIKYTLDGSDPTETNGTVYSTSKHIYINVLDDKNIVLKVRAFFEGESSEVNTQIYNYINSEWVCVDGNWQYLENGIVFENGVRSDIAYGPKGAENGIYYFKNGYLVTGLVNDAPGFNGTVYFEADSSKSNYGAITVGWVDDIPSHEGRFYYFDPKTYLRVTGWLTTTDGNNMPGGLTYYLLDDENDDYGVALGWKQIGKYEYYFRINWNGALATDTIIDGHRVDSSGRKIS